MGVKRDYCPNPNCGSGDVVNKIDPLFSEWFACNVCGYTIMNAAKNTPATAQGRAGEMFAERVTLDQIRADIAHAFHLAKRFEERREDTRALVKLDAAENRVAAFLCGSGADQAARIANLTRQRDEAIGQRDEANARLRWRNERDDDEHLALRAMLKRVLDEDGLDTTLRCNIERLLALPVEA